MVTLAALCPTGRRRHLVINNMCHLRLVGIH